MKPRRVIAIAHKEFLQIIRDPRSLALAIAIPILLLVLFGTALTLDVDKVPLVIWNQDKSKTSRDFILNFSGSRYFKIVGYTDGYEHLQQMIDKNKALMALVIPVDFSKLLLANQTATVQLIVDGSDSSTATIAAAYANSVASAYNTQLFTRTLSRFGIPQPVVLDMQPRVWFNPDLKSRNFIIPGLISVIMTVIAALLTSLTITREWERGTMEQLISTPVKPGELILGKFLPYFAIGCLDLVIAIAMAQFIYHIPLRGSLVLLFIVSAIFIAGAMSLGILISASARNQLMASQLAILTTFLPAFLLSGFAYAIYNMPRPVQIVTYLVSARYFITVLKGIYLKGVGIRVLWPDILFLIAFTLIMVVLAKRKFKKKVA
jgi:ABC-2 type transport system permease protein